MKPEDFDLIATLVKQRSGLMLTRDKAYLLESRLLPVVRKYSLPSLEDMAQTVRSTRDEAMMSDITQAMTTNESSFFRDRKLFAKFREVVLPQLLASRAPRRQIRVWSAAAASGQEAYSVAMICAEEAARMEGWKIDILGTDISREMIARASSGIYSHFDVQRGLPIRMLIKYFRPIGPDKWQVKDELRQMVQFREGNLLHDFGPVGIFDVILCRNVLMYFDSPTQTRVLNALGGVLAPDGILTLGAGETVSSMTDKFRAADGVPELYVLSALQGPGLARQMAG